MNLSGTRLVHIFVKKFGERFKFQKQLHWSLKNTETSYKKKIVYTENSGKKFMGKRTEIIQNRKCPKSFNICFSLTFSYPDQSVLLNSKTEYWALCPTNLEFLLIFLVYLDPNSPVVQQLVRQLLYKVFILKIKSYFGCSEWNLYKMRTCFITLFSWLSEKNYFALYDFNNDSNFLHNPIFSQKWMLYEKSGSYQC